MSDNNENGENGENYEELTGWTKIREGNKHTAILDGESIKFEVEEKLAYAGQNRMDNSRGTTYYIFRTEKGSLILYIGRWTKYQGEISSYELKKFDSKKDIAEFLDDGNSLHRELMKKIGVLEEIAKEV